MAYCRRSTLLQHTAVVAGVVVFLLTITPVARADNCGGPGDCYGVIAAAVAVAVAIAVLGGIVGLGIALEIAGEAAAAGAAEGLIAGASEAAILPEASAALSAAEEADEAAELGEVITEAGGVSLEDAVGEGLVNESGKLFDVLNAMEQGFKAMPPNSAIDGLGVIARATASVGLDIGVASVGEGGAIILQNVGGITTTILPSGEIVVSRGLDILLHLIP